MKKIFLSAIVAAAAALPTFAAVDTLNYSAVIRNAQGEPVANQEVTLLFQFLEDNTVKFEETAKVTTSAAGVVNYAIGTNESLENVDWKANDIKLAVSVDVNGGDAFVPVANSNVASVPTALYALKSADTDLLYEDIDNLYGQNQRTQTVLNDVFAKISATEDDIDNLYGMSERNEGVLNDVFAKINMAEEDIDALYGKAERTENQLNQVAADFANLGENLDNLVNQMEEANLEQDRVIENLTNYAEVVKATLDDYEATFANLDENLTNSFAQVTVLQDQLDALIENLDNSFKRVEVMEEQVEANTTAIAEVKKDAYDAFEDVYQQLGLLDQAVPAIQQLEAWHRDNDEFILSLAPTLNAMNENIDQNSQDIEALQRFNAELVATLTPIEETATEALELAQAIQTDAYAAFEEIYQQLGEVETITNTLTDYIEQDQIVSGKVEAMEGTVNYLRDEVEANTADIEALQGADSRFQTVQNDLFAKIGLAEEDIDALNGTVNRHEVLISNLQSAVAGLQNQISTLHPETKE